MAFKLAEAILWTAASVLFTIANTITLIKVIRGG